MALAPIVLFIYNRPNLTRMTLEALAKNELADQSTLYIYCDGPKDSANAETIENIAQARRIAGERKWCREVIIYEKEHNLGLAKSIISGVTEIVNTHGNVIVLEDDLETSPYFLRYMNDALAVYRDNKKVISIGACNFFAKNESVTPETFFIPIPDCWGWATWKDRWELFEPDSDKLYKQLKEKGLIQAFNLFGNYPFESMLQKQIMGQVNSWAIRWQAVAYLNNMLALYPQKSMTIHKYSDTATHAKYDNSDIIELCNKPVRVKEMEVEVLPEIFEQMLRGYRSVAMSGSVIKNMVKYIFRLFKIAR